MVKAQLLVGESEPHLGHVGWVVQAHACETPSWDSTEPEVGKKREGTG